MTYSTKLERLNAINVPPSPPEFPGCDYAPPPFPPTNAITLLSQNINIGDFNSNEINLDKVYEFIMPVVSGSDRHSDSISYTNK